MFASKSKSKEINWKLLGTATPERIQKITNTGELEELIDMITYCNIDREDFQDLNLIKLFKLSQMINELLKNENEESKKKNRELESTVNEIRIKSMDSKNIKDFQISELEDLKKENKLLKKTVYAYQMAHKLPANQVNSYYKCDFCSKSFTSDTYLESHVKRRHNDCLSEFYESKGDYKSKRSDPLLEKITEALSVMSNQINQTETQVKELYSQQEREREEKMKYDFENKLKEEREKWFLQWEEMKKDIVNEIKEQESVKILDDKPELDELKLEINHLKKALRSQESTSKHNVHTSMKNIPKGKSTNSTIKNLYDGVTKEGSSRLSKATSNPRFKSAINSAVEKVNKEAEAQDSVLQSSLEDIREEDESEQQGNQQELEETQNEVDWEQYKNILKNEIFSPLEEKPWIKSFYKHSESQVIDEKPVLLRDINKNIIGQEHFDLDRNRPFFNEMKEHLIYQIDAIASQKTFKSKPQLQIDTTSTFQRQRDSGNATSTLSRSASPRRITWRDYRVERPPSPSRIGSPLKTTYEDDDWSDEEVDSPIFKTLSLNRPKLYQSFKNKELDARQIANSLSPAIPKANPFIVAKAATQFKGLLRKKDGAFNNSPLTPSDGIFNRGQSPLSPVEEESEKPRIFDRRNLLEKEGTTNNFDSIFSRPQTKLTMQESVKENKSQPMSARPLSPKQENYPKQVHQNDGTKRVVIDEDRFESDVEEF